MCTREEIQEIIDNSVIKHLSRHEGRELAFHNLIIKNQTMLDDKLDQALISVRESVPSSLSKILTEMKDNQNRIESKVDMIFPTVTADMQNANFWRDFRIKFGIGGKTIIQMVLVIGAFVMLFGYVKTVLLAFLGIQR